jgi:hypothetical protein
LPSPLKPQPRQPLLIRLRQPVQPGAGAELAEIVGTGGRGIVGRHREIGLHLRRYAVDFHPDRHAIVAVEVGGAPVLEPLETVERGEVGFIQPVDDAPYLVTLGRLDRRHTAAAPVGEAREAQPITPQHGIGDFRAAGTAHDELRIVQVRSIGKDEGGHLEVALPRRTAPQGNNKNEGRSFQSPRRSGSRKSVNGEAKSCMGVSML